MSVRCVVTGGAGFIGANIATRLVSRGYDVTSYDLIAPKDTRGGQIYKYDVGDIRDTSALKHVMEGADYIFHLAGILGTAELFSCPEDAIEINIRGALNVLKSAKAVGNNKCRIFLPAKPNEWNNIYSVTSQAVEKLGHCYREFLGLDVRILRLRTVYGPGQKQYPAIKIVPSIVGNALMQQPIKIFGTGEYKIELQFVDDVSEAIIEFMFSKCEIANTYEYIGSDVISVAELARKIVSITNSKSALEYLAPRIGESPVQVFQRSQDISDLISINVTSLAEGLEKTISWYKMNSL